MKRYLAVLIVFSCLLFASCKKASGPADLNSIQPDNRRDTLVGLTVTVNDSTWSTTQIIGYDIKSATDSGSVSLFITATQKVNGLANTINLNITDYTGPNTYTINPPLNSATYYIGTQRHYATSGQIIIATDANYAVTGTFNFIADSINVSAATFNIATP